MEDKTLLLHNENSVSKPDYFWSKDTLDLLFKVPFALAGFFYVSGIFVQGFYFGRLGISTLNLFKLSYIMAGFWAVYVIILPAFVLSFGVFLLSKPNYLRLHYKTKFPRIVDTIIRIAIVMLILGIYSLITQSISPFLIKNYFDLFQIIWLAFSFSIITILSYLSIRIVLQKMQTLKVPLLILYSLIAICVFVGCVESFSKTVYLNIPSHLGGGNPISANLIFKSGGKELSFLEAEMGYSFERNINSKQDEKGDDDGVYSVNVFLLTETDEGFYIKTENNRIVFLRRDSVLHITYFGTAF